VVPPGGGPRDEFAPKVVKSIPDSAQLNFNSRKIILEFDEYIQLRDQNNQLIISPPLERTPEINVKNKTLTIDLEGQQLKPNTTYSINFGTALQDINENNPKENFSYIFSTGNFIDSLKVRGKVQHAFDEKTEKGILVMLYSSMDDSVIYKALPEYFAKTGPDGAFEIRNIREGKYRIAALKDVNSNFRYDGDAESIAFSDTLVSPSEKNEVLLKLFAEPPKKAFVKKYTHPSYSKVMIVLNKTADSLSITNMSNDRKGVQEFLQYSKNRDTINYWMKNYEKDSLILRVNNGIAVIDTLKFKMIKLGDALKARRNSLKLSMVSSPNGSLNFNLASALILGFNNPLADYTGEFLLEEDTAKIKNVSFNIENLTSLRLVINDTSEKKKNIQNISSADSPALKPFNGWKENTKYKLFIPQGALTDIFGLKNDTIRVEFTTRDAKFYGSLKLTVDLPLGNHSTVYQKNELLLKQSDPQYILQLLDEREIVIREHVLQRKETISYEYLSPSKYRLKLIYDKNGNGKWDSGDYLRKMQPEDVIYNKELITIRSNWDAEIVWKVAE
jgi:hypothetical protein